MQSHKCHLVPLHKWLTENVNTSFPTSRRHTLWQVLRLLQINWILKVITLSLPHSQLSLSVFFSLPLSFFPSLSLSLFLSLCLSIYFHLSLNVYSLVSECACVCVMDKPPQKQKISLFWLLREQSLPLFLFDSSEPMASHGEDGAIYILCKIKAVEFKSMCEHCSYRSAKLPLKTTLGCVLFWSVKWNDTAVLEKAQCQ